MPSADSQRSASELAEVFRTWSAEAPELLQIKEVLWPRLQDCAEAERSALLRAGRTTRGRWTLRCSESGPTDSADGAHSIP